MTISFFSPLDIMFLNADGTCAAGAVLKGRKKNRKCRTYTCVRGDDQRILTIE